MPLQQISTPPSATAEVQVNENFETMSHMSVYGKRQSVTSGLTWGYYGGLWGGITVADGTVTLTNAATNYLVVARSTAATNWNDGSGYARLYRLTTAGSVVTAAEDHRAGPLGAFVPATSNAAQSVASAAALTLPQGVRVVTVTGTTGITSIVATGHSGHVVTLIFAGILTVTDGSNLKLASSYTTTADDTLTLACDGVSWYEVARSVN
jgi:hypothetical protein